MASVRRIKNIPESEEQCRKRMQGGSCTDEFMAQRERQSEPGVNSQASTWFSGQTFLYVGGGAEDVEPLQSHADGSQLSIQSLQTFL